MFHAGLRRVAWLLGVSLYACTLLSAQTPESPSPQLNESGEVLLAGQSTPYLIRHLPVNSFPEMPAELATLLNRRGCLIPQTYQAHHPENVIHASLEGPGSSDWAVLCSSEGTVSLLVYLASAPAKLSVLAAAPETERLQAHDPSGILGFNWGIDPATPKEISQAQAGLDHRPARVDHDALADTLIDHRTVYHFYLKGAWIVLETPE
ncbi:MAG: hypothetical protein WCA21_06505 [Terracidiphilus sp.]